jgi:hypothetical protein
MAAEFKIIASAETDKAAADITKFTNQITKQVSSIDDAFISTQNQLAKFKTALGSATEPGQVAFLRKNVELLEGRLAAIGKQAQLAGAKLGTLNKSVGSAIPTLTNFGRVVQDAPFGIIGIANNIDPLIESFQRLKASTGSTGAALKSLFSALAGPAGIAIGVSAVTSALIAFGPQIASAIFGVKELTEEEKKLAEKNREVAESLATEIIKIQSLASVANDELRSKKDRVAAIEELRKKYPEYLQGLTNEEALSKGVASATDAITKSLIRRIVLEAAREKITKEVADQLEKALSAEKAIAQEAPNFLNATKQQTTAYDQYLQSLTGAANATEFFEESVKKVKSAGKIRFPTAEELSGFGSASLAANRVFNKVQKSIQDIIPLFQALGGSVNDFAGGFGKADKAATSQATSLKNVSDAAESAGFDLDKLFASIGTFTTGQEKAVRVTTSETSALLALAKAADAAFLAKQKTVALDKQKALGGSTEVNEAFDIAIKRGFAPAILDLQAHAATDAADGMAKYAAATQNAAIAADVLSGVFNSAFQALSQGESPIQAITQSLKQLIVRLAAAAATAAVLSLILGGITGGAPVIAGAASNSFGGIFKSLLGLASGGIASRPTPALIGDGGAEAVIPLSQLANIIGGVAMQMGGGSGGNLSIVRGQDIYYSNNNASRSFGRLFG